MLSIPLTLLKIIIVSAANLERLDEALASLHVRLVDGGVRRAHPLPGGLVVLRRLLAADSCCSVGNGGRN
jgi:hypothetical protein